MRVQHSRARGPQRARSKEKRPARENPDRPCFVLTSACARAVPLQRQQQTRSLAPAVPRGGGTLAELIGSSECWSSSRVAALSALTAPPVSLHLSARPTAFSSKRRTPGSGPRCGHPLVNFDVSLSVQLPGRDALRDAFLRRPATPPEGDGVFAAVPHRSVRRPLMRFSPLRHSRCRQSHAPRRRRSDIAFASARASSGLSEGSAACRSGIRLRRFSRP
jgi:hypothetical protein